MFTLERNFVTNSNFIQENHTPLPRSPFSPLPSISLFSGGGGMDIGFEASGFKTHCCIEKDRHSCITLRSNREWGMTTQKHTFLSDALIIEDDIYNVNSLQILKETSLGKNDIALIYGGPPCQAFSVFGKRKGLEDERGMILWEFVRIVNQLEPEAFSNCSGGVIKNALHQNGGNQHKN
jgi:DNA (cytosine-5)-methyltransferase 1